MDLLKVSGRSPGCRCPNQSLSFLFLFQIFSKFSQKNPNLYCSSQNLQFFQNQTLFLAFVLHQIGSKFKIDLLHLHLLHLLPFFLFLNLVFLEKEKRGQIRKKSKEKRTEKKNRKERGKRKKRAEQKKKSEIIFTLFHKSNFSTYVAHRF